MIYTGKSYGPYQCAKLKKKVWMVTFHLKKKLYFFSFFSKSGNIMKENN